MGKLTVDKLTMEKLKSIPVLLLIFILFVLVIIAGRVLFLKQEMTHSNAITAGMSAQSFGRGFSNTGSENLGEVADPNYKISFPKDHYSHDTFDIEWWYLTANLQDEEGKEYGLQWTLFRFRNPNFQGDTKQNIEQNRASNTANKKRVMKSQWNNQHIYMAHASVHSESKHWFSEKFARGAVGNAGVEKSPFKLFIDDWQWTGATSGLLPASLSFKAKLISDNLNEKDNLNASHLKVQLNLSNTGAYVLQGKDGYSIKSGNGKHASHYYSAPFISVDGGFTLNEVSDKEDDIVHDNSNIQLNQSKKKIVVKGKAWFDQEWTSQLFNQATLGWDWLSLHLDNGDKIMAFRMRLKGQDDYITGTYIKTDGSTSTLYPSDIDLNVIESTKVGNKKLPLDWQLKIESKNVDISIKATKKDQWNPASIAYYEGTVGVNGTHTGKGFLELTGY